MKALNVSTRDLCRVTIALGGEKGTTGDEAVKYKLVRTEKRERKHLVVDMKRNEKTLQLYKCREPRKADRGK